MSMEKIQQLREMTGAGMMDCKEALKENDFEIDKAVDYLRLKGKAKAAKKASRTASEGIVYSYIHPGDKLGVLVELNCETDFVAKTDEFHALAKELAMQVAATDPKWLNVDDVDADALEREKSVLIQQLKEQGKPEQMIDKIVEGKLGKFYSEHCLMEQFSVREEKKTIKDIIEESVGKIGENIKLNRFTRFQIGQ